MPSIDREEPGRRFSAEERRELLGVARASIENGLRTGMPLVVDPRRFSALLQSPGASFVTLRIGGRLRGCIGSVEAVRPLVHDVAVNAFNAAFRDPRFPPLTPDEYPLLDVHISVLSPVEPLPVRSEQELLQVIRPGIDGLILQYGPHRGLLLPAVWEELPDPQTFVRHVKLKAGLPADFWAPGIQAFRFTTESFGEGEA
ncbi:MAG: AmmeMemoRadiSam system protein A [Planctomycetota bacterium]|nr:MAG: AmmeMemoRadiSam system protein A [Planctomycetota bacterium]